MLLALQINTNDPMFWVMVVIALSFVVIALAMVSIAVFVSRAVKSVNRLEAEARAAGRESDGDERTGTSRLPCRENRSPNSSM